MSLVRGATWLGVCMLLCGLAAADDNKKATGERNPEASTPRLIGHRGLIRHAPENTLAGFAACLDLRLGFEVDVRRTKDGHLVCMHDDHVRRTTDGTGRVSELSLAELRRLDAGRRFDPAFAGQRVPTLDEVFALIKERKADQVLVAVDFKITDETVADDVVGLAAKHGVLGQLVCIGTASTDPALRSKLRAADPRPAVAVLAPTAGSLATVLAERDADWVHFLFVPTAEQVAQTHKAGKRVLLGRTFLSNRESEHWQRAREARVDALLTDFPLECRQVWRSR